MAETKKQIVIVGGGFSGVRAALKLAEDNKFDITLISDQYELRYYPTLFHTATGSRQANSSIPLKDIFKNKPVKIVHDTAVSIDRKNQNLVTKKSNYRYDSLILGLGVVTNYFNIPGLDQYSFSIKTQDEAAKLKAHLHSQLTADHRPDLNYVIIGAGPTGIELAASLPCYLTKIMRSHNIEIRKIHIDLIEAAPKLLPKLPSDASRMVKRQLKRLGIKIYTKSMVQGETADSLTVNGKPISSHTVIWTAGVTNNPFFSSNNFSLTNMGKVSVDVYLRAEKNIYVIGDNANTPYSGLAQTALRDGTFVAKNIRREAEGHRLHSYRPKMPTTIIPVGPHWAAVIRGQLRIYGYLGWILREFADIKGFHDLEPWKNAASNWVSEFRTIEECPTCASNEMKS